MSAIPRTSEDITTNWLNEALTETGLLSGDNAIVDFKIEPVGADLGYLSFLFRITPSYSKASIDLPATMIAKFPSTEEGSRRTGNGLRAYERESQFYKHCSHESPTAPPAHYYSCSDRSTDDYLLIMEDLDGCRFVNQVDGVSRADALQCFKALAAHHALYWGKTDQMDWAPAFSDYGDLYQPLLVAGAPQIQDNWGHDLLPTYVDHVDMALAKYTDVTRLLQLLPTTLIHCDPRIENIAFKGDLPRFYDWQLMARGPAAYDLMYFFKQSMDVDIRRNCQDELFDAYLDVLAEHGIDYSRTELLDDIGLATCTIWGFVAMIGNFFFRNEVNDSIWDVTQPRFMAMIEDFNGIQKLRDI